MRCESGKTLRRSITQIDLLAKEATRLLHLLFGNFDDRDAETPWGEVGVLMLETNAVLRSLQVTIRVGPDPMVFADSVRCNNNDFDHPNFDGGGMNFSAVFMLETRPNHSVENWNNAAAAISETVNQWLIFEIPKEKVAAPSACNDKPVAGELPSVDLKEQIITYKGKTYAGLNHDILRLFDKLVAAYPQFVVVSKEFPDEDFRLNRMRATLNRDSATKALAKLLKSKRGTGVSLVLPKN